MQEVFVVTRILQGDAKASAEPMTDARAQQVVTSFLAGAGPTSTPEPPKVGP